MSAGIGVPEQLTLAQTASNSGISLQLLVGVCIAILLWLFFIVFLATRFKRCPSNRILVIWGKNKGVRCFHGGGQFVWPVLEDYAYLSLDPLDVEVELLNGVTKDNIRVNMTSVFVVGITTDPTLMLIAAERLLGLPPEAICEITQDIVLDEHRKLIRTISIDDINNDPQKVLDLLHGLEHAELTKVGLEVISQKFPTYPAPADTNAPASTITIERSS